MKQYVVIASSHKDYQEGKPKPKLPKHIIVSAESPTTLLIKLATEHEDLFEVANGVVWKEIGEKWSDGAEQSESGDK